MARKGTLEDLLELSLEVARLSDDPAEAFAWLARLRGRRDVGAARIEAAPAPRSFRGSAGAISRACARYRAWRRW